MQLIVLVVVGLLAGFIARAIMPYRNPGGLGKAILVGIIGSFVGGFLSSLLQGQPVTLLRPGGVVTGAFGAIISLWTYLAVSNLRTQRTHATA